MIAPNAQERLTQIVEPLLFWYQKNKRSLPWRDQPTPYRVWVSEIMLQQTRVEAVKPYFERFLSVIPIIYLRCGQAPRPDGRSWFWPDSRFPDGHSAICKKLPACWSSSTTDSCLPTTDS